MTERALQRGIEFDREDLPPDDTVGRADLVEEEIRASLVNEKMRVDIAAEVLESGKGKRPVRPGWLCGDRDPQPKGAG